MNFLAHLYLSGNDEEVKIGNFIADNVRSSQHHQYSTGILAGIRLHHFIDSFTDSHPVVQQSKQRLYEKHHKYAAVIVDVFYDHFLAAGWQQYSALPLADYTLQAYNLLQAHAHVMPERVQFFLPYMVQHDWLTNYAQVEGAGRALAGLSGKARLANRMNDSVHDLRAGYDFFQKEFDEFFPELEEQCARQLEKIKTELA